MSACSDTLCAPPHLPPDSPGSSVSSGFKNEYNDILRRAVLIPPSYPHDLMNMDEISSIPNDRRTPIWKSQKSNINSIHFNRPTQYHHKSENSKTTTSAISNAKPQQQQHKENAENNPTAGRNDNIEHHPLKYSELITTNMETKPFTENMDHWYLDLKNKLMNNVEKLRLQFLEEAQQTTLREKQKQAKEYIRLDQDIKLMKDMLTKYELTVEQKEEAEKNLNNSLSLLCSKTLLYRRYYEWRTAYGNKRRQIFTEQLAKDYYEQKLKRQIMSEWKKMIGQQWKQQFEVACEKKAKDVCLEIGNDYGLKYTQLELQLKQANEEIARLKQDRNIQDEPTKQAFMRGVCALNLEAMSVLLKNTSDEGQQHQDVNNSTIDQTKRTTSNELLVNNCTVRQYSSDEHPSTSTTTDERYTSLNSSQERPYHSFPTHVYKEYLPSTTYRTLKPYRQQYEQKRTSSSVSHGNRHVTFRQRQTYPSRHPSSVSGNSVIVERHAPINSLPS